MSHSLLLYHFGSTTGLLSAVHLACEQRQRDHFAALRVDGSEPAAVVRSMWLRLADPAMWPLYRLGFALRVRSDVPTRDQQAEREAWQDALAPLLDALGVTGEEARDEALLWVATCRGLLWELVTGADETAVHQAADRFFAHYPPVGLADREEVTEEAPDVRAAGHAVVRAADPGVLPEPGRCRAR